MSALPQRFLFRWSHNGTQCQQGQQPRRGPPPLGQAADARGHNHGSRGHSPEGKAPCQKQKGRSLSLSKTAEELRHPAGARQLSSTLNL